MRAAALLPRRASEIPPAWIDRCFAACPPSPRLLAVCGGNRVLAALLQARDVGAADAAALLAVPGTGAGAAGTPALADPFLLPQMETAVACLHAAARSAVAPSCVVFGDYDCDGLTATALLAEGLTCIGLRVQTMLPHRLRDGYGLSVRHVEAIAARGGRLLVTVDCGTTAHAALARASALGLTVIVSDHHPPAADGSLPPCAALLNPRRADSRYPDRDLCGVGMAHTLLRALAVTAPVRPAGSDGLDLERGLDLVALGTIADVVPLRGENRILVRQGLTHLARTARPGLRALRELSGLSRLTLTPRDIAFGLAPRLNAAGRLGDAGPALALLQARRPRAGRLLAADLEGMNRVRQELTRVAEADAIRRIEATGRPGPLIVLWDASWHPGVVGLVAARLVERYGRPAVVVGQLEGRWRGSARSVEGFDIGAALGECADLLVAQGGHPLAAGLEAAGAGALATLSRRLEARAAGVLRPEGQPPTLLIDLHLAATDVDGRLAAAVEALQPYGAGWPEPIVAIHRAPVLAVESAGGAGRLVLAGAEGMAIPAPARPEVLPRAIHAGTLLDLAAIPVIRDRRGYRCLELEVLDARVSGMMDPAQVPAPTLMV